MPTKSAHMQQRKRVLRGAGEIVEAAVPTFLRYDATSAPPSEENGRKMSAVAPPLPLEVSLPPRSYLNGNLECLGCRKKKKTRPPIQHTLALRGTTAIHRESH